MATSKRFRTFRPIRRLVMDRMLGNEPRRIIRTPLSGPFASPIEKHPELQFKNIDILDLQRGFRRIQERKRRR